MVTSRTLISRLSSLAVQSESRDSKSFRKCKSIIEGRLSQIRASVLTLRAVAIFTSKGREQLFAFVSIREIDDGTTSTTSASCSYVR